MAFGIDQGLKLLREILAQLKTGSSSSTLTTAAKGATVAGSPTSRSKSADVTALDVQLVDAAGNPIVTFGSTTPQLAAGENHIGEISENIEIVSASTITVTASSAYAAGDSIGGKIQFSSAFRVSGGKNMLSSILLMDKSNNKNTCNIIFFNADPSAATLTDKTGFVFSTDNTKVIRVIQIAAADWVTINSIAICDKIIGEPIKATSGTTLYAAIVNTGAPTYSAASDFSMNVGMIRG